MNDNQNDAISLMQDEIARSYDILNPIVQKYSNLQMSAAKETGLDRNEFLWVCFNACWESFGDALKKFGDNMLSDQS